MFGSNSSFGQRHQGTADSEVAFLGDAPHFGR
jgi:hypothetical protein